MREPRNLIAEEVETYLDPCKRSTTVPRTASGGMALEIFSARFMASMPAFNQERVPSRPLVVGAWWPWLKFEVVEGGGVVQAARKNPTSVHLATTCLVSTGPLAREIDR